MLKSKYKCCDKVWFMNDGKPASKFVYQISWANGKIWYTLTSTSYFMEIPSIQLYEKDLYSTEKELLSQTKIGA